MKDQILKHLEDPAELEILYRQNKSKFRREFNALYPEIKGRTVGDFWFERLNYENEALSWGTNKEKIFIIIISFLAGLVAKFPDFTGIDPEFFYPRNLGFIVFPFLAVYFAWKEKLSSRIIVIALAVILISALYINLLPGNDESDTLVLACVHLLLVLWGLLGFVFVGDQLKDPPKRLEFLRYNGDLIVMTTILLIAGGLMTAVTIGLFSLIGVQIEEFYFQYIVIWGLAAAPLVATYLVRTNPLLVNKVSPVIAKVFTPLLLIVLVTYLSAVIFTGKDPYNDREFLLLFNGLLIGVMAIILFSISETSRASGNKISRLALFALSAVTIIVNLIALSAILFRISEGGITPNRLAVLGGNLLILTNLVLVTIRQYSALKDSSRIEKVENSIASFLPAYIVWAGIVFFLFPVLFGFQ